MPSAGKALKALRRHRVPAWWSDAKLGVFVHWTPASVPGWAPVDSHVGELMAGGRPDAMAEVPYTEWYQNSLRFPDSSVSRHHRETWGDTPYSRFTELFREGLEQWDPDDWARRFAAAGARYVVLVTKHHDGFCLWPTGIPNPHRADWTTGRDVVGELREAVLGHGMRFGVYYSGGLDWTFEDRPIGSFGDLVAAVPGGSYTEYAAAQVRELIDRYRPAVLWNDICWPGRPGQLWALLGEYYRRVPDGVVNDRWMPAWPLMRVAGSAPVRPLVDRLSARTSQDKGLVPPRPPHFDVRTPEYAVFDHIPGYAWECVRGMDQSFGFNRNSDPDHFLSQDGLLETAADIVSKGGNLLLNVGPRGEDASIPVEQLDLLDALGDWSRGRGRSIFASRPWVRPEAETAEGHRVQFWFQDRTLSACVAQPGRDGAGLTLAGVLATPTTSVATSGGAPLEWQQVPGGLRVLTQPSRFEVIELRDVAAG